MKLSLWGRLFTFAACFTLTLGVLLSQNVSDLKAEVEIENGACTTISSCDGSCIKWYELDGSNPPICQAAFLSGNFTGAALRVCEHSGSGGDCVFDDSTGGGFTCDSVIKFSCPAPTWNSRRKIWECSNCDCVGALPGTHEVTTQYICEDS